MNLVWAVLIVLAATVAAVAAMLLVRRRAPDASFFQDGDRAACHPQELARTVAVAHRESGRSQTVQEGGSARTDARAIGRCRRRRGVDECARHPARRVARFDGASPGGPGGKRPLAESGLTAKCHAAIVTPAVGLGGRSELGAGQLPGCRIRPREPWPPAVSPGTSNASRPPSLRRRRHVAGRIHLRRPTWPSPARATCDRARPALSA
jgi:hypothetical protein